MVFCMISAVATGPLVRLYGKIDATVYNYIEETLYLIWELQLMN